MLNEDTNATNASPAPPEPEPEPERDALLRALRNLEASQARVQQNAERVYDEKRRELVSWLLPVLDNLDRTLDAARAARASTDTSSERGLVEGVRMIRAQLEGVLVRYGVQRVDVGGEIFDPAFHEAVAAVPVLDPRLVGRVVHQSAPGYSFGGKVLRAAKVNVGVAGHAARGSRMA